MITTKSRLIRLGLLATVLLLLLAGCGRSFSSLEPVSAPVADTVVAGTLQYLVRLDEGPLYNFTMNVPAEWVGTVNVRNGGNVLYFDYIGDGGPAIPLFSIEALSEEQLWKQEGGYPAYRSSILNTVDTYFVYHLPIDAYYSGVTEERYAELVAGVPALMTSFTATLVQ